MAETRRSTASEIRERDTDGDTTNFPGHIVTGVCMIVAPLVLLVSALLSIGVYHAKGIEYVQAMAEHHTKTSIAFEGIVAGLAMLIFAVFGLAQIVSKRQPGYGRWGGVITILGLMGPLFFNGVYFAGFQLTDPETQGVAGKMMDSAQIVPSNVINLTGPALLTGFIILAIGASKAQVMSRNRAIALGLMCIMPVGFISGFIAISGVAFAFAAIAMVPLGVQLLQSTPEIRVAQPVESGAS